MHNSTNMGADDKNQFILVKTLYCFLPNSTYSILYPCIFISSPNSNLKSPCIKLFNKNVITNVNNGYASKRVHTADFENLRGSSHPINKKVINRKLLLCMKNEAAIARIPRIKCLLCTGLSPIKRIKPNNASACPAAPRVAQKYEWGRKRIMIIKNPRLHKFNQRPTNKGCRQPRPKRTPSIRNNSHPKTPTAICRKAHNDLPTSNVMQTLSKYDMYRDLQTQKTHIYIHNDKTTVI